MNKSKMLVIEDNEAVLCLLTATLHRSGLWQCCFLWVLFMVKVGLVRPLAHWSGHTSACAGFCVLPKGSGAGIQDAVFARR